MKPIIETIISQVRMEQEEAVYKAVLEYGISVDKQRLLKALNEAQSFYAEGYEDGYKDGKKQAAWDSVKEDE